MPEFLLTDATIATAELTESLRNAAAGAFVAFEGWVRDHHDGREVKGLEYEAFAEMAQGEGKRLLDEARQRFAIIEAHAVHRTGSLAVGDCAIWVGVTAAHRQEAFLACRWIMDTVKDRLPVWKKEFFVGCEPVWVHASSGSSSAAADPATLTHYSRQLGLPLVGVSGQGRLAEAQVLVIGAGGLGCPALQYLAAAGVGTLTIVDGDCVEASNLHRQILFGVNDLGRKKAAAAAERLRLMNPHISIRAVDDAASAENLPLLLKHCDVVLDGTDNFESKYTVHDMAWQAGVPLVQASVYQLDGIVQVFDPRHPEHGCFRCLWPEAPPSGAVCNCAEAGVLGVTPGLLGVWQATEAIKLLLEAPDQLRADTLHVDVLGASTFRVRRQVRPDCACQGMEPWPKSPNGLLFPGKAARDLRMRASTIDLREPEELAANPSGLPEALHLPRARWHELCHRPDGTPVVLCCAGGVRARQCLEQLGHPKGLYAWTRSIQEWAALTP
jgi:adenylyltransferase/sulfurtransferase